MNNEKLYKIVAALVVHGKGILAADQSPKTMNKQLAVIAVPEEAEMRRIYRQALFTTHGIEKYVTGVILHDGTIRNYTDDKILFADILIAKGIVPIIKVDKSTVPMTNFPDEKLTDGLDGLAQRLEEYHSMGARAAKWRAVIQIGESTPTTENIKFNCLLLARYAALCQEAGIVPIVEPEVIYKGAHTLEKAEEVTTLTLKTLFTVLMQYRVDLKAVILKSSMVLAGSENSEQTSSEAVAEATLRTFKASVPPEIPGIVFLSGGQTPEQATENLNAIAKLAQEQGGAPWPLTFSFSRGIEQPVQQAWAGKKENIPQAQEVLIQTLEKNSLATKGEL